MKKISGGGIQIMFLGIDYGKKRIGLALGQKVPKPFLTIENLDQDKVIEQIKDICDQNEVKKIIIGLPEEIDQNSVDLKAEIKKFGANVKKLTGGEVIFEPEAYTSVEAEERLKQSNQYDRMDRGRVDRESAVLLLEQYINKIEAGE